MALRQVVLPHVCCCHKHDARLNKLVRHNIKSQNPLLRAASAGGMCQTR